MANWQEFRVVDYENFNLVRDGTYIEAYVVDLDKYIEFSDGYYKRICVRSLLHFSTSGMRCGNGRKAQYIEIDIDRTKCKNSGDFISPNEWRSVPNEVISQRALARATSLDPRTSAFISDGISRMNRGEIGEFEHKMVDNSGSKHQFIYRK